MKSDLAMNGFRILQQRLRKEGWYVDWNLPCCQSCAWSCLPFEHEEGPCKGKEVDFHKVLFNHSQDCEVECDWVTCLNCGGEGEIEEEICTECDGDCDIKQIPEDDDYDMTQADIGFVCFTPEQQTSSMFCFGGDSKGVENLKAILPIIEECGCTWHWDQTGKQRIEISWENN